MLPEQALQLPAGSVPLNPYTAQIESITSSGNEPDAWMRECEKLWDDGAHAMTLYFLGLDQHEANTMCNQLAMEFGEPEDWKVEL